MIGLFLALATALASSQSDPHRLPPVEQCAAELGFGEFRARLKRVVKRKDEQALLSMLSPNVEVNFGGDHGPALFAANWKFAEPGESHVWTELEEALRRGCAPSGDALVAPSFVAQFPEQMDPFETVIIPPGTPLRSAASAASSRKGGLDWHLATIIDDRDPIWVEVRLVDGRKGFVRREQVVEPLDYRLVFEKRDGQWMIAAFVAGD